ncbi:hypothetical protein A2382_02105 [Candidatus Woesebacteria bacterium RIFOXYB1_FULL_38_16]|uniref:Peptidase M16 n=1 Tax=Candidatus Woesebacteria bacterium RIFOXYB1_FULL_38_16 TaxID=1802538 RepID=A0A1F8CTT5_9BACT|nr:MAG: hypothetical protein A2191_05020 [Candidatus Woesebacteria bacterium RIFOXYA1_FULL_38_9]OGM79691.1 MAG: hypothetical protein A2382_02105 [Candidatus Woesebacteria bacterium RIFOXYB1_FULL_38_16]
MKPVKTTLFNNLRLLTIPMPNLESATITVWTKVGSRHETKKLGGISHFLEHIVFKGTKNYPTAKALSEAVDNFGGEINAGTGKEITNFYIKSRKTNIEKAFSILSDLVLHPLIKPDDIKRERGVILSEIAMYEDTPASKVWDLFENLIFTTTHPLGRDIIGTKDSVMAINEKDFQSYRKEHYHADNMLVTVAGGVNSSQIKELADKYFSTLTPKLKSTPQKFISTQTKPQLHFTNKKTDQTHLLVGFRTPEYHHKDRFAQGILATILGRGMSSRLFTEVREKRGLAYAIRTTNQYYEDTGYLVTYAGVDHPKVEDALKVILDQYQKLTSMETAGITKEELKKAKEFAKGHLALSLEDTDAVNNFFGNDELMLEVYETPAQVYQKIDAVTSEEVIMFAKKHFTKDRLNLAFIGPQTQVAKLEKLLYP